MLGKQWSISCLFHVCFSIGEDSSNLEQYLSKTHQDWAAGLTSIYLAAVVENHNKVGSGRNSISSEEASDLIVSIGDGGHWEGYTNGALPANKEYRYGQEHISGVKEKVLIS